MGIADGRERPAGSRQHGRRGCFATQRCQHTREDDANPLSTGVRDAGLAERRELVHGGGLRAVGAGRRCREDVLGREPLIRGERRGRSFRGGAQHGEHRALDRLGDRAIGRGRRRRECRRKCARAGLGGAFEPVREPPQRL